MRVHSESGGITFLTSKGQSWQVGCEGCRAGFTNWDGITQAAASLPNKLPCLRFALQLDPSSRTCYVSVDGVSCYAINEAAQAGCPVNLKTLDEAGCQWTGDEVECAIPSDKVDATKFCLEYVTEEFDWFTPMYIAIVERRSPEIMQLLYEAEFPSDCMSGRDHPVCLALAVANLDLMKIAVKYSGVTGQQWLDPAVAARGGEALLRYVHGLHGGTLPKGTAEHTAGARQLAQMQIGF